MLWVTAAQPLGTCTLQDTVTACPHSIVSADAWKLAVVLPRQFTLGGSSPPPGGTRVAAWARPPASARTSSPHANRTDLTVLRVFICPSTSGPSSGPSRDQGVTCVCHVTGTHSVLPGSHRITTGT